MEGKYLLVPALALLLSAANPGIPKNHAAVSAALAPTAHVLLPQPKPLPHPPPPKPIPRNPDPKPLPTGPPEKNPVGNAQAEGTFKSISVP